MQSFNDYVRDYQAMGLSRSDAEILAKETLDIKAETDAEWKQGKYKDLKAPAVKSKPRIPVFKMITDHLGQQFNSTQEMCDFYKIPVKIFNCRRVNGWSLTKALTQPVIRRGLPKPKVKKVVVKDHLGHEFRSQTAMCAYWNINRDLFVKRIERGWSLERALTEPIDPLGHNRHRCEDHLGHVFLSVEEMCAYWGINLNTFHYRRKRMGLEQALTTPLAWKNKF